MDIRIFVLFTILIFTYINQAEGECPHPRFRDKHYISSQQVTLNDVLEKSKLRYRQAAAPIRDWWYGPPSPANTVVAHAATWASVTAGAVAAHNPDMQTLIDIGRLNENDQLCTSQATGSWIYTCRALNTPNPTCEVIGQCATYHLASNGIPEPPIDPTTGKHTGNANTWGNTSGHLYFQNYFMAGKCV